MNRYKGWIDTYDYSWVQMYYMIYIITTCTILFFSENSNNKFAIEINYKKLVEQIL